MGAKDKTRLDQRLVDDGLAESRAKAQALVMAGLVVVDGEVWDKPGTRVRADAEVVLKERLKYVSRGGLKLEPALEHFGVDPAGKICLDVGASTGGFTDVLLQCGATKVYAVDVGEGILDWKLRNDPRVVVREKVNARFLLREHVPEAVALAVIDVSFISLTLVLPAVVPLLAEGAEVLPMVKPQFEAGRERVGKGGVVRDEAVQIECVDRVAACAAGLGLIERGRFPSPVKGPKGNQEYFLLLKNRPDNTARR